MAKAKTRHPASAAARIPPLTIVTRIHAKDSNTTARPDQKTETAVKR
jgi:hypothetical protein